MFAAFGQGDAERARGLLRVIEEQLVKVTHAVEQQAVGMGSLDLEILRHHRRRLARTPLRLPGGPRIAVIVFVLACPRLALRHRKILIPRDRAP